MPSTPSTPRAEYKYDNHLQIALSGRLTNKPTAQFYLPGPLLRIFPTHNFSFQPLCNNPTTDCCLQLTQFDISLASMFPPPCFNTFPLTELSPGTARLNKYQVYISGSHPSKNKSSDTGNDLTTCPPSLSPTFSNQHFFLPTTRQKYDNKLYFCNVLTILPLA